LNIRKNNKSNSKWGNPGPRSLNSTGNPSLGPATEQASGKKADRRADIWSFGAVLYEMLSGKPAFTGESVSDTLATVLKLDPDWSALPKGTPSSIVSRFLLLATLAWHIALLSAPSSGQVAPKKVLF
jgi:serine/threonine protein kinase